MSIDCVQTHEEARTIVSECLLCTYTWGATIIVSECCLCTDIWGGKNNSQRVLTVYRHMSSSAKFRDLGVRSLDFLTKNWPLTNFPTYSRLIWQSFFHTKNHRKTWPTGHQRPPFAVIKFKISPVAPPFGLSSFWALLWPAAASILPI